MTNDEFYLRCAEIVGVETVLTERSKYYRRNRWNNRKPGNGRFPGVGIIRVFGSQVHVALTKPETIQRIFMSKEESLAFLETVFS